MKVAKINTHNAIVGVNSNTSNTRVIAFVIAIAFIVIALWLISRSKNTEKNKGSAPMPPVSPPNDINNQPPGYGNISYIS